MRHTPGSQSLGFWGEALCRRERPAGIVNVVLHVYNYHRHYGISRKYEVAPLSDGVSSEGDRSNYPVVCGPGI